MFVVVWGLCSQEEEEGVDDGWRREGEGGEGEEGRRWEVGIGVGEVGGCVKWEVGEEVEEEGAGRVEVLVDEWVGEGAEVVRGAGPVGVASYFLKQCALARCSHVSHTIC